MANWVYPVNSITLDVGNLVTKYKHINRLREIFHELTPIYDKTKIKIERNFFMGKIYKHKVRFMLQSNWQYSFKASNHEGKERLRNFHWLEEAKKIQLNVKWTLVAHLVKCTDEL